MPLLRDIVTRLTFRTDTTPLKAVDQTLGSLHSGFRKLASIAVSGWAMRTGGDILSLRQRVKDLYGEQGFKYLTGVELPPIVSNRDWLNSLAGIRAIDSMFDDPKVAAGVAHLGVLLEGTLNESLATLGPRIASAIKSGDLASILRESGLISTEAELAADIMRNSIMQGASLMAPQILRLLGQQQYEGMTPFTDKLQKRFEERLGIAPLHVKAQWSNLWDNFAVTATTALGPVLETISKLLIRTTEWLDKFGGGKGVGAGMERLLKPIDDFLSKPIDITGATGMTIGALLGYLLWGWKGAVIGGLSGGAATELFKQNAQNAPISGTPSFGSHQAMKSDPFVDWFLNVIKDSWRTIRGRDIINLRPSNRSEPLPGEIREGSSMNWRGDVYIQTQATDPEGVAQAVRDTLKREFRLALVDQG